MTAEQLHDAITELDDALVEETDRLRRPPERKAVILHRITTMVACATVVICGMVMYWGNNAPTKESATEAVMAAPQAGIARDNGTGGMLNAQRSGESADPDAAPSVESAMEDQAVLQPPTLTVRGTEAELTLSAGSYWWTVVSGDEAKQARTDSPAPWEMGDSLTRLAGSDSSVGLEWEIQPDHVAVYCYPAAGGDEEPGVYQDGQLTLKQGDWLYAVSASFPEGEAEYTFRAER